MGLNARLVIFLGCLYSNMLGATLMYYQYSCYELTSIFAEDAMDLSVVVEARVSMMILASLFTIPVNAVVSIMFMIQTNHLDRLWRDGKKASINKKREGACCRGEKSEQICFFIISTLGWTVAFAQIVVSSVAIVILTAAETNGGDNSANVPCHCRISHNKQQSGRWLTMIGLNTLFWLLISRPGSIGLVLFLTQCKQRATNEWDLRKRRTTIKMEMVAVSLNLGNTDAGEGSGDVAVEIPSDSVATMRGRTELTQQTVTNELSIVENNGDDAVGDCRVGARVVSIDRRGSKPKIERRSMRFGSRGSKASKDKKIILLEPCSVGKQQDGKNNVHEGENSSARKRRGKKTAFAVEPSEVRPLSKSEQKEGGVATVSCGSRSQSVIV